MTREKQPRGRTDARTQREAVGLLFLFAALLSYAALRHLALPENVPFALSPYLFPGAVGLAGTLLAGRLFFFARGTEAPECAVGKPVTAALLLALFFGMALAMPATGFLPAAAVCLALALPLLGERRVWVILVFSLLLPLALYLLFDVGFGVMLP